MGRPLCGASVGGRSSNVLRAPLLLVSEPAAASPSRSGTLILAPFTGCRAWSTRPDERIPIPSRRTARWSHRTEDTHEHRREQLERAGIARHRHRLDQLAAAHGGGPQGEGGPRRLLDLHLHQLAPDAAIHQGMGREVQGRGAGGDRGAYAGVQRREATGERALVGERPASAVSDRGGQRLHDLAGLQQQLLAGGLPHRCAGARSLPSLR